MRSIWLVWGLDFLELAVRDVFNKRLMLVVSKNLNVCNLKHEPLGLLKKGRWVFRFFLFVGMNEKCRN